MKIYNGQLALILAMAYCQFVYDVTFYPADVKQPYNIYNGFALFQIGAGTGVSTYSNVMAVVVGIVIVFKKSCLLYVV